MAQHVDPLFDAHILQAITRQLPDALLQAHALIQRDMDELPNGAAFPCKHKMTGDYYIAEHRFDTCTDPCTSEVAHHFGEDMAQPANRLGLPGAGSPFHLERCARPD